MTTLSARFTLEALSVTSHGENPVTAVSRYGRLVQPPEIRANLTRLAIDVLEPLAAQWGWRISSCYRSPAVNSAVGGSANSAHLVGLACDGGPAEGRGSFADVIRWLGFQRKMPLDRVIWEAHGGSRWIHVQALAPGLLPLAKGPAFYHSPGAGAYLLTSADVLAGIAS